MSLNNERCPRGHSVTSAGLLPKVHNLSLRKHQRNPSCGIFQKTNWLVLFENINTKKDKERLREVKRRDSQMQCVIPGLNPGPGKETRHNQHYWENCPITFKNVQVTKDKV